MAAPSDTSEELQQRIQAAGKQLVIHVFSLLKTGELHDLNNDAYLRPSEKLIEVLDFILKVERQAVTMLVYEGVAQVNGHALWLDPATQEIANELEKWLARREAGGVHFMARPSEDELRRFFYHFARFRAPADAKSQLRPLSEHLIADGITRMKLSPQPVRLEGVGQGIRGVASLWHYAKASVGVSFLLEQTPIDTKLARRLALELVDTCATEQDFAIALPLLGVSARTPGRQAVDVAVLAAAICRGLGLSAVHCADLVQACLLHEAGRAYGNPDPTEFTAAEAAATLAVKQLADSRRFSPELAQRVSAGVEFALGAGRTGPPYLPAPPTPAFASQLIMVITHWLDAIRGRENRAGLTPAEATLAMYLSAPRGLDPALVQVLVATVGLLPVGTLVELHNQDIGVVTDVEHLRGRSVYRAEEPPVMQRRKIFIDRMRTPAGQLVPERLARVQLGDDAPDGSIWRVNRILDPKGWEDVILRAMVRRPSTVVTQMGLRA